MNVTRSVTKLFAVVGFYAIQLIQPSGPAPSIARVKLL